MNKNILIFTLIALAILTVLRKKMNNILPVLKIRKDAKGDGHFGASRSGGTRPHNGVDLEITKGENVYAPFEGTITKQAYPYENDRKFTGVHLTRADGLKLKVFYMQPRAGIIGKKVNIGDVIGTAQAISEKYGSPMHDHIHVEVWKNGKIENPEKFFNL